MLAVELESVSKRYFARVAAPLGAGLWDRIRPRPTREVIAVDDVSFTIERGEAVGFVGPNGAGKTTTVRMIAGLVQPSAGAIRVAGIAPSLADRRFLRRLGFVSGQRQRLAWDLPATASFELNRVLYDVPRAEHRRAVEELVDLLGATGFVDRPVRTLSLGQRMKCDLICALAHQPDLLLLDEPTIGLDAGVQRAIRTFLRSYVKRHNAALLLTSHYMEDITAICERAVVIRGGKVIADARLSALTKVLEDERDIELTLSPDYDARPAYSVGRVVSATPTVLTVRVPRDATVEAVRALLRDLPVVDVSLRDVPLEQHLAHLVVSSNG